MTNIRTGIWKKTLLDKHQIRSVSDIYAHAINHVCLSSIVNEDFEMLLRWFRDKSQTADGPTVVSFTYTVHTWDVDLYQRGDLNSAFISGNKNPENI